MVAALGVTLPGQPKCEGWFDSAQSWASAVLADWDTWKARERIADHLVDARGRTDCLQCQLARAGLAADERQRAAAAEPAAATPVAQPVQPAANPAVLSRNDLAPQPENCQAISFEPIVSELGELCPIAFETRTPVTSERVADQAPGDLDQLDDHTLVCGAGDCELALPRDLASSKPTPTVTIDAAEAEFLAFSALSRDFCSETACMLDEEFEDSPTSSSVPALAELPRDVFGPSAKTTAASSPRVASGPPTVAAPGVASATPQVAAPPVASGPPRVAATGFVSGPPRVAAPRVASGPPRVVTLPDLPRDVFGPSQRSPERKTGSSRSLSTAGRGVAGPRLGHAVELTRDALYAWMNVLTGPALVDVTSR